MKDEYIIINKTVILKRIEELESEISYHHQKKEHLACKECSRIKLELEQILTQSTPLIPEIEKAFDAGKEYGIGDSLINKKHCTSNLKLEV